MSGLHERTPRTVGIVGMGRIGQGIAQAALLLRNVTATHAELPSASPMRANPTAMSAPPRTNARPPVATESAEVDRRTCSEATATVLTSRSTATITWGAWVRCDTNRARPNSAATKCTENIDVLSTTATNGRSRSTPSRGSPSGRR